MKILVTGGRGFIGSHLVETLVARNHEVLVLDNKPNMVKGLRVKYILGDVTDENRVHELIGECDGVINLAGRLGTSETIGSFGASVMTNIIGAYNVFSAVREHKVKAVQIAVGNHTWLNTYAITKTTTEKLALMFNQEFDTKIAVIRGLNVYGPRQRHTPVRKLIPTFIVQALRGEALTVYGSGEQLLDLIHVNNMVQILAMGLDVDHNTYNSVIEAGTGQTITVNEVAKIIKRLTNSKSEIVNHPMRPGEPAESITVGDPMTLIPLNFDMGDFIDFEKGIEAVIWWYKDNYPWQLDVEELAKKLSSSSPSSFSWKRLFSRS